METSVLKPGLLVSLKTSINGGADYQRTEIERDHTTADGAREARWETRRIILDPAEYEAAIVARSKARGAVLSACRNTGFGLLCPTAEADNLQTAIDVARGIAEEFNATAKRTTVSIYVITGRIAADDAEAARAISSEVRELLNDMEAGIKRADPEAIREAANKARVLGGMLTEGASIKVNAAVDEARKAASLIIKRVEKAGELAEKVVVALSTASISAARFAFLDIDMPQAAPVVTEQPATREVDLPECAAQADTSLDFTAPVAVSGPELEL